MPLSCHNTGTAYEILKAHQAHPQGPTTTVVPGFLDRPSIAATLSSGIKDPPSSGGLGRLNSDEQPLAHSRLGQP